MLTPFESNVFATDTSFVPETMPSPSPVITSAALLANGKLIHIQHRGELYSLRETRLGKLILTK